MDPLREALRELLEADERMEAGFPSAGFPSTEYAARKARARAALAAPDTGGADGGQDTH